MSIAQTLAYVRTVDGDVVQLDAGESTPDGVDLDTDLVARLTAAGVLGDTAPPTEDTPEPDGTPTSGSGATGRRTRS